MRLITVCLLFSLLPAAAVTAQPGRGYALTTRLTRRLPAVDKVELEKYKTHEMRIESVEATKTLEGGEARRVARLWRAQNYRPRDPMCHYPVFGIKFYSKGALLLHASVCWECDNIAFMTPRAKGRQGFNGRSAKGKELLGVFLKSF